MVSFYREADGEGAGTGAAEGESAGDGDVGGDVGGESKGRDGSKGKGGVGERAMGVKCYVSSVMC